MPISRRWTTIASVVFALTPEQLRSQEIFPQIQPNQLNWLCRMIDGYKAYAENAVLAYDLCRAIAVAQMGFMVGHLTLEEGLKFCWQASVILQDHFSGWDELLQKLLVENGVSAAWRKSFVWKILKDSYCNMILDCSIWNGNCLWKKKTSVVEKSIVGTSTMLFLIYLCQIE